MKTLIVGIFDRKAQMFISMEPVPNKHVAMRSFTDAVNRPESPMHKWPDDYELYELGEWDSETGAPTRRENESCEYERSLICDGATVKSA